MKKTASKRPSKHFGTAPHKGYRQTTGDITRKVNAGTKPHKGYRQKTGPTIHAYHGPEDQVKEWGFIEKINKQK